MYKGDFFKCKINAALYSAEVIFELRTTDSRLKGRVGHIKAFFGISIEHRLVASELFSQSNSSFELFESELNMFVIYVFRFYNKF